MYKSLDGKWKLDCTFRNQIEVNVPGSIYNDLFVNGFIEEPYYRANEEKMLEIMKDDFIYTKEFKVTKVDLSSKIDLVFLGIDTISEIYLNEVLIDETFNMHRRYRYAVNDYLHEGDNVLKVVIKSPLKFMAEEEKKLRCELMNMSYAVKGYNHIRKAHCMFGWDWGPQMPDGGIWRSVYLDLYDKIRIDDCFIRYLNVSKRNATLDINLDTEIVNPNEKYNLKATLSFNGKFVQSATFPLENLTHFTLLVDRPHLWYPNGYGEQPLYDLKLEIISNNTVIETRQEKFGIRKVEILRKPDQFGETFTACVNDQPIFLKGSDYIIEDNIFPRRDNNKTKFLLGAAKSSNQNVIRVWGGGIYPDDFFYEECDRLGLLVWQDLMFACGYYNMENQSFVSEIKEEIKDNLKRIRNHACLMLVCGNNENETAISWNVPNLEYTKKWYLYQYEELIPPIVKETCPDTFYWPSSPSSGGGFDNPNDDSRGDMHYWGVWHNNEPIENYRKYFPRVLSEFGMQSFPTMKTINSFTEEEDRNIYSYVMERHQKNNDANQKIMNYIGANFKFPKDFNALVYLSEVMQAEALRYAVEHLRRNYGRCMGAIYWQLNDCWPVASWSSIDYYNRYKALQYYAKRFFEPVIISIEEESNEELAKAVVTNETSEALNGNICYKLCDFNGNIVESDSKVFRIDAYSAKQGFDLSFKLTKDERRNLFLYVEFTYGDHKVTNDVSFAKDKHLKLVRPIIRTTLYNVNSKEYKLTLESDTFAKHVVVEVNNQDIIFSDNYFNLYPNEPKEITFTASKKVSEKAIKIYSLTDSF